MAARALPKLNEIAAVVTAALDPLDCASARFLRFMVAVSEAMEGGVVDDAWREASDAWAAWVRVEYGLT